MPLHREATRFLAYICGSHIILMWLCSVLYMYRAILFSHSWLWGRCWYSLQLEARTEHGDTKEHSSDHGPASSQAVKLSCESGLPRWSLSYMHDFLITYALYSFQRLGDTGENLMYWPSVEEIVCLTKYLSRDNDLFNFKTQYLEEIVEMIKWAIEKLS